MTIDQRRVAELNSKAHRLRELLRSQEILVMPGAYDALSARLFESLGFPAIQCSSAAIAAGLGCPDGERLTLKQTVDASRRIAEAVAVPVNGDGERGYGDVADTGRTVRGFVEAGCVGMNIEDSLPHAPGQAPALVPLEDQLEKIEAALAASRALGVDFFLNARVDALMAMPGDPPAALREAIVRGQAYADAGADCIFYMRADTREVIRELVRQVPAPVSVLAGPRTPPLTELQELGVARVSYGGAFGLVAAGAMRRLAVEIREKGTLTGLSGAMSRADVMRLMER